MTKIRPDIKAQAANHIIPSPLYIEYNGEEYADMEQFEVSGSTGSAGLDNSYRSFCGGSESASSDKRTFSLSRCPDMPPEAYGISLSADSAEVTASDERGFFNALQTLLQMKVGTLVPSAVIRDAPALGIRGFHINTATVAQISFKDMQSVIKQMGKFKLNTLLLEYNERFPSEKHAGINGCNAFLPLQIAAFEELCRENFIEIIPLVQSLGHVRHILRHEPYSKIAETAEKREQMCPLKHDSFELFKEIASEIMNAHPGGKYLHIGGDETRQLGACPLCAEYSLKHGKGRLYADYINKVCAWVKTQGRTPVIWDDMLSSHPEAFALLTRDVVVMYWDYWTSSLKTPIVVARAAGTGIVCDSRWKGEWHAELSDPEKSIVDKFSQGVDMSKFLEDERLKEFIPYFGDDVPKRFTAFPNLEFFRDRGFRVIGAPTTLGNYMDNIYGLPNYARFHGNVRSFAERCASEGMKHSALGLVTTAWYNFPPEILSLGIIYTGQFAWTAGRES